LLAGQVEIGGGEAADVDELVLADLVAHAADVAADPRVHAAVADLATAAGELGGADINFHLAGVVSGAAEADFEQLVADYTRKGFVRRRSVRLMTVAVRTLSRSRPDPSAGPSAASLTVRVHAVLPRLRRGRRPTRPK
jgi:hypothetical protein